MVWVRPANVSESLRKDTLNVVNLQFLHNRKFNFNIKCVQKKHFAFHHQRISNIFQVRVFSWQRDAFL